MEGRQSKPQQLGLYFINFKDFMYLYVLIYVIFCGPGSSVGIEIELRAGRSGIESRWVRDFTPVQTGRGAGLDFIILFN